MRFDLSKSVDPDILFFPVYQRTDLVVSSIQRVKALLQDKNTMDRSPAFLKVCNTIQYNTIQYIYSALNI